MEGRCEEAFPSLLDYDVRSDYSIKKGEGGGMKRREKYTPPLVGDIR